MEISGKPPTPSTPRMHEADRAENKADEVQGQRGSKQTAAAPIAPLDISATKLAELSEPERGARVGELQAVADPDARQSFRREFMEHLISVGASEGGADQQRQMVRFLQRSLTLPEQMDRLAWANAKIRDLLKDGENLELPLLEQYLHDHGLRLQPHEKPIAGHPQFQVDRPAFRDAVRQAVAGGQIDRRAALTLLGQLEETVDVDDLFWCRQQILRGVDHGLSTFADSKTERLVRGFFDKKLGGRVGISEWGWAMRRLRQSDGSAASLAEIESLFERAKGDFDSLYYAKRQLAREVRKARRRAEKQPSRQAADRLARLEGIQAQLNPRIDAAVEGNIDRYRILRQLTQRAEAGSMSPGKLYALRAAALTARSEEDFVYGVLTAATQLRNLAHQAELLAALEELLEELEEKRKEDELETRRLEERRLERQELERQIERLRLAPLELERLTVRAWLRGSRQRLLSQLEGEPDPERRASLEASLAQTDTELVDLEVTVDRKD